LGVHQVAFGEDDNPPVDAQEIEDLQVFLGLGHPAFVGRDHKQHQPDAANTGQHIADEAVVTRHVHDARFPARGQRQPGKSEVDGHAPGLFFLEPVGVDVGQDADEGGLAVVNVAGGAYDVHVIASSAPARPSAKSSSCPGSTARRSRRSALSSMRPMMGGSWRRKAAARASTETGTELRPAPAVAAGAAAASSGAGAARATASGAVAARNVTATAALGCPSPGSDPPPTVETVDTTWMSNNSPAPGLRSPAPAASILPASAFRPAASRSRTRARTLSARRRSSSAVQASMR